MFDSTERRAILEILVPKKANPLNTWRALLYWAPFHDACATLAQLREDESVHLYTGYEIETIPLPPAQSEREEARYKPSEQKAIAA